MRIPPIAAAAVVRIPPIAAALAILAVGLPCLAHGPSIDITAGGFEPVELHIQRGETVHFHNRDGAPHRVRGADDSFQSPELGPDEGWHLRFGFAGRFEYALEGQPERSGTIVVGEPKQP